MRYIDLLISIVNLLNLVIELIQKFIPPLV